MCPEKWDLSVVSAGISVYPSDIPMMSHTFLTYIFTQQKIAIHTFYLLVSQRKITSGNIPLLSGQEAIQKG